MSLSASLRRILAVFALSGLLAQSPAQAMTNRGIKVYVKGLVCAFCAQGLTKAMQAHALVDDVAVEIAEGLMILTLKPGKTLAKKEIGKLVEDAGFEMDHVEYPMDDM